MPCEVWYTRFPEEGYFPTLMSVWDALGCVSATLTHVDWRGSSDEHPCTYEASEMGPNIEINIQTSLTTQAFTDI
ncbi:hypothetical protein L6164_013267 [Bauhinia variegata]|uniref:Uncharacterized protein n=1 Tax=Bauhinia variegata TaxID=167791 RepID=A0ACB9PBT2_BAUVA|nr:hypothetical protein L6164_013267 [Bauhinia variegata]